MMELHPVDDRRPQNLFCGQKANSIGRSRINVDQSADVGRIAGMEDHRHLQFVESGCVARCIPVGTGNDMDHWEGLRSCQIQIGHS